MLSRRHSEIQYPCHVDQDNRTERHPSLLVLCPAKISYHPPTCNSTQLRDHPLDRLCSPKDGPVRSVKLLYNQITYTLTHTNGVHAPHRSLPPPVKTPEHIRPPRLHLQCRPLFSHHGAITHLTMHWLPGSHRSRFRRKGRCLQGGPKMTVG